MKNNIIDEFSCCITRQLLTVLVHWPMTWKNNAFSGNVHWIFIDQYLPNTKVWKAVQNVEIWMVWGGDYGSLKVTNLTIR